MRMKMEVYARVGFRESESTGLLDRLCSRNTDVLTLLDKGRDDVTV